MALIAVRARPGAIVKNKADDQAFESVYPQ